MLKLHRARYPRRRVRIDIAHIRRKSAAITRRSDHDLITVTRAGKGFLVLARHDYLAWLETWVGVAGGKKMPESPRRSPAPSSQAPLRHRSAVNQRRE
ncbi:MAG: hypothetical protein KDE63_05735 [Novosphingobium sp.]|nr:hypothetical protein [Novosphingobium sp.]